MTAPMDAEPITTTSGAPQVKVWCKVESYPKPFRVQICQNAEVIDIVEAAIQKQELPTTSSFVNVKFEGEELVLDSQIRQYSTSAGNPLLLELLEPQAGPSSSKRPKLTELELSASDQYCTFYDALKMAQVQNDVLQLPNEVTFLNAANLPSKLYVRRAYEDLHSLIHDTYRHRSILVVGNPGTGKSFFALYEMHRLLKDGATIVYECVPFSVFMVLTAEQLLYAGPRLEMQNPLVQELFRNRQTYYLFDAGTQRDIHPYCGVEAKTIVFSLPAKRNYVDYVKHSDPKTLYMPVWTLDELEEVVDSVQAQTRYEIWGGIPRYVLKLDQNTTPIDDALATLTLDSLHDLAHNLEQLGTQTVSHTILHIHVQRDEEGKPIYECRDVFFASDYVKEKVFRRFASLQMDRMCSYVENVELYNGFVGQLFEMLAHHKLAAGGTFSVRKLQSNCSVSKQRFTKFDVEHFEKVDDLRGYKSRQNVYLRPRPRNFTSLDSIIIESPQSVIGVQITVSSSHPVKQKGLTEVMKNLQCQQAHFKLFFVVPKKVFDDYKPQRYTGSRGGPLASPKLHVEQWVLLLKLCEE